MTDSNRSLRVFLCHASADKPAVRELYKRLIADGVDAWLDAENLIPGQNWQVEIPKAIRDADVVLVCLSEKSVNKEGYVQKEIKFALDIADEKPEGTIFIIPARLENCETPNRLSMYHWVDLYESDGYEKLMRALRMRANNIGATLQIKKSWFPSITSPGSKKTKTDFPKNAHEQEKNAGQDDAISTTQNNVPPGWEDTVQPSAEGKDKPKHFSTPEKKNPVPPVKSEKKEVSSKPKVENKQLKWDSKNISIVVAIIALGFVSVFGLPSLLAQTENTLEPTLTLTKEVTKEPGPTETMKVTEEPSLTPKPSATPTKTRIPTSTAQKPTTTFTPLLTSSSDITATNFCGENIYVFKTGGTLDNNPIEDAYISSDEIFVLTGSVREGFVGQQQFLSWGYFLETTGPFHSTTHIGPGWAFVRYDNIQCVRLMQGNNVLVLNRDTNKFEIAE